MRTLNQWLQYIDSVHRKKIDLSLERVAEVARRLNLLPFKPFAIIVAGTNGKGSTSSLIAQALTNAGYKVGSTLSPHLKRFNERIKINMQEAADEDIIEAFEIIEQARAEITLSYFEFNTLASLYLFEKAKIDIAVLEVGLGGEFDAVNIVEANLAVITNVALDHIDLLGSTREAIGQAKAGIIRPDIPVIYGETDIPDSVQAKVLKEKARLVQYGRDYTILEKFGCFEYINLNTAKKYMFTGMNVLPINAAGAITVLDLISDQFPVPNAILKSTVEQFSLVGRCQVMHTPLEHIYDVAHNPHSINVLNTFLEKRPCSGKTIAIFSMLNTKDLIASLASIQSNIDVWYFAPLQQEKSITYQNLENACDVLGIEQYQIFSNLDQAYSAATECASLSDRIAIFGSFHTVSELLR